MTSNGDARDTSPNATNTVEEAAAIKPEAEVAADDPIAALEAEKIDLKDRLMRALAETENLRRRAEREAKDARAYAIAGFARDMLNVADNIRRALDSAKAANGGDDAQQNPTVKALIEGVELTERDLLSVLGRHGVKLLEPEGQKFDPNFHQAMFEVPNEEVPSGTVVQVVQSGYAIGDRVLRPAMVGVAKGGPKPAPSPSDNPES
jgi:molecular chaperone GrpE